MAIEATRAQAGPIDPWLETVPDRFETERLVVRCPRAADATALNAAVVESLDDLRPWMLWAQTAPTLAGSEAECRRMQAQYLLRQDLPMFVFARDADGSEGPFVAATGLHRPRWDTRRFAIGYWCRAGQGGQGLMTEAVRGLIAFAFKALRAHRLEIRMDDRNEPSWRLAERVGFQLEGTLQDDDLDPAGGRRSTRVYTSLGPSATMPPS